MPKKSATELAEKLEAIANQLHSLATELRGVDPELPAELLMRFDRFSEAKICLHCGKPLGEGPPKRGLHPGCYATLMQRVSRGNTTEDALVNEGRLAPRSKSGRKLRDLPLIPELTAETENRQTQNPAKSQKAERHNKPGKVLVVQMPKSLHEILAARGVLQTTVPDCDKIEAAIREIVTYDVAHSMRPLSFNNHVMKELKRRDLPILGDVERADNPRAAGDRVYEAITERISEERESVLSKGAPQMTSRRKRRSGA